MSLSLALLLILAGGCHWGQEASYPEFARSDTPYQPQPSSSNSFDTYVSVAQSIQSRFPDQVERVSFTTSMKHQIVGALSNDLAKVSSAAKLSCVVEVRFRDPFSAPDFALGLRQIGRALAWRAEFAIEEKNWRSAVQDSLTATKIGMDLAQGDAQLASLGYSIMNDVRKVVAPNLEKLSQSDLKVLSDGLFQALARYPGVSSSLDHEEKRSLLGLQFVQDCYRKKDFAELEKRFGKPAKQAVSYLKDLSDSKRQAYFEGFNSDLDSTFLFWKQESAKSKKDRIEFSEQKGSRPWKKFASAFTGTIEPLISMADTALAKTRIFAISSWAMSYSKLAGKAPTKLTGLPKGQATDPFSGQDFFYIASGSDFRIYSIGSNTQDDGGESDEMGLSPDIVLETELH